MKARIPKISGNDRKRLLSEVEVEVKKAWEKVEEEKTIDITRRVLKTIIYTLNTEYGYGIKRITRLFNSFTKMLEESSKDEPTMSDLKESGGLEQDSDYVILLHRPYVQDKESGKTRPSETKLKLDKNKFGNTGIIYYNFNGMFQRFSEVSDENETERIARPISTITAADDLPF